MQLTFRGLTDQRPGDAWREVFASAWPGWRSWFVARGGGASPRLSDARLALRRHMPEMESLWDELVQAVDGDETAARFLSFWCPPRYLVQCSQIVVHDDDGPLLLRNYDLDPTVNESTMLHTAWRGRRVVGMAEGMAGLADGLNDAGLAASLTFGGRRQSGRGFGIPLIVRYVLEVSRDVVDAREALLAVPCHMSYNVTVADRSGAALTAFLAPDRPAIVSNRPLATNHQVGVEWPRHGRMSRTEERERHLERLLADNRLTVEAARSEFLRAPLFSSSYDKAFGTVYTAAYRPATGEAALHWREGAPLTWNIDDFEPAEATVAYSDAGSRVVGSGAAVPAPVTIGAPEQLAAFFIELSSCLAGRGDWARIGEVWRRPSSQGAAS